MLMDPEVKMNNDALIAAMSSNNVQLQKTAADDVEEFIRMRARETTLYPKIQSEIKIEPSELTEQLSSDRPAKVVEKEAQSPGAYSLPFGQAPYNYYMGTTKALVVFDRICSYRLRADTLILSTYKQDLREAFHDLLLNDIGDEIDEKAFFAWDAILGTLDATTGTRVNNTGAMGYVSVGSFSRAALSNLDKGLGECDNRLSPNVVVVNNTTIGSLLEFGRDTVGGDLSEKLFRDGYSGEKIMNRDYIVTIKQDIVATNVAYVFAAPESMGKYLVLEPLTMWTKNEAWNFELMLYTTIGGIAANDAAACKGAFAGSFSGSWRPSASE